MYSVIVPIYKVEQYLENCIDSILNQTYTDFELILVDDGSPDKCPLICDEYAKKDNRIKVIHKENGGLISARKAGLKMAIGSYVCFIDGDDFIANDLLYTYEQTLSKHEADIICAGYSEYYNDNKVLTIKQKVSKGYYDKNSLINDIYNQMLSTMPFFSFYIIPSLCTKCFKRNILEEIYSDIEENITIGEDVAVTYPALLLASSICVIEYYGYMYRQNNNSMTHSYDKNLYVKMRNLILHLKRISMNKDFKFEKQINEYIMFLLILAKNNEFKYNYGDSYRNKKMNLKKYLKDPLFEKSLEEINISGIKNIFLYLCFKYKFCLPIYIYERMNRKRS